MHINSVVANLQDLKVCFYVPAEFKTLKAKLQWEVADNVSFYYFTEHYDYGLLGSFKKFRTVLSYARKEGFDRVFFLSLINFLPFILLYTYSNIQISGILYVSYLNRFKRRKFRRGYLDLLKIFLFGTLPNIDRVLLLNDRESVRALNNFFFKSRFVYLPDPVMKIEVINRDKFRLENAIGSDKKLFAHLGSMTSRKGTLKILEAILRCDHDTLKDTVFVFAGSVSDEIIDDFQCLYLKAKQKARIILINDFCNYDVLAEICSAADLILLPYTNVDQSSGFVGYGAFYRTSVLVPNSGLLSRIVLDYGLGGVLGNDITSSMADYLMGNESAVFDDVGAERYVRENSDAEFKRVIASCFNGS